ncbi:MAG: flagellar hook assembly protein FlgD [Fidelibacterota bacterium]
MFELGNIGNTETNNSLSQVLDQTGLGKDDFFRLLIEQMKNQDPLEPMKNQDFTAQLAQFSSLEKLDNIDSNIEQGTQINLVLTQAINNSAAATIIGKEVKAWGDVIQVKEGVTDYDLNFNLQSDAAKVTVDILDGDGNVVKTIEARELGNGDQTLQWDRTDTDGNLLDPGAYTVRVQAWDGNDTEITAREYTVGVIEGIRYEDGSAVLIVDGEEIPFSDVIEIGTSENG